MDRRAFVGGCVQAVVAAATVRCNNPDSRGIAQAAGSPALVNSVPDRLLFGAPLTIPELENDGGTHDLSRRTSDVLVVAGPLYWSMSHPRPGEYSLTRTERALALAKVNAQVVRGHPLVWEQLLPDWVEQLPAPLGRAALLEHVERLVRACRGRVRYWDVLNEVIRVEDGRSDALRETIWLRRFGAEYARLALLQARAADAGAFLGLNDFGLENDSSAAARKRIAMLRLLDRLKRQNSPLDYVGLQAHLKAGDRFSDDQLGLFIREVESRGLRIMVTELDVDDTPLSGDLSKRDLGVADTYRRFLDVVFRACEPVMVNTWGLTDRSSWLQDRRQRSDGLPLRPLPFDAALRPKAAWNVLRSYGLARTRWEAR